MFLLHVVTMQFKSTMLFGNVHHSAMLTIDYFSLRTCRSS